MDRFIKKYEINPFDDYNAYTPYQKTIKNCILYNTIETHSYKKNKSHLELLNVLSAPCINDDFYSQCAYISPNNMIALSSNRYIYIYIKNDFKKTMIYPFPFDIINYIEFLND